MTDESTERDAGLAAALREITPDSPDPDWTQLRRAVVRRAEPELARRRSRPNRRRFYVPATLAASFALLLFVSRATERSAVDEVAPGVDGRLTIDEILDADVSDGQFRALLFGAAEAEALLLMAATETELP